MSDEKNKIKGRPQSVAAKDIAAQMKQRGEGKRVGTTWNGYCVDSCSDVLENDGESAGSQEALAVVPALARNSSPR